MGIFGKGADGVARGQFLGGGGGSGGANGVGGEASGESGLRIINGGAFGGGGGGSGTSYGGGWGGGGAVRIIWGTNRAFPTTNDGPSTVVIAATVKSSTIGGSSFNRESLHVYTNGMPYPEIIGIDRVDQIITVDTITDDAVKLKLFAFQNLSAATAGSRSITNSLIGSETFFVAGTGTDGATALSAYWI